jgi:hypothetical protein
MIKTIVALTLALFTSTVFAGDKPIRRPFQVNGLWCYGMIMGEDRKDPYRRAFVTKEYPYTYMAQGFAHSQGEEYIRYDVSGNHWSTMSMPSSAFAQQHKDAGEKCFKRLFPGVTRKYMFDYPTE